MLTCRTVKNIIEGNSNTHTPEYSKAMEIAVNDAKSLFELHEVYKINRRLDGNTVTFADSFISKVRHSLTTSDLSCMNNKEEKLMRDFVDFQNTGKLYGRNNTSAGNLANLLDDYLVSLVN